MSAKRPIPPPRLKCAFCEYRCWKYAALYYHARVSHPDNGLPMGRYSASTEEAHDEDAHKWRLYQLQEKRKVKP